MARPGALGLIEGIAEATSCLLKLASAALSDRSGRSRPWIVAGYGLASLSEAPDRPGQQLAGGAAAALRRSDGHERDRQSLHHLQGCLGTAKCRVLNRKAGEAWLLFLRWSGS